MSWLNRIRGRAPHSQEASSAVEAPACTHIALVPRWNATADMGNEDKASEWVCDVCGAVFSPADAQALRETEAERVKSRIQQN